MHTFCEQEELPPLDKSAMAEIVEYASRMAGDHQKLSTRFSDLAQIIKLPESLIGQDLNITTDGSVDFILDGDKIVIFKTTSVPEPSTYAAIFGLCALAFVAYRKRG